MRENISSVEVEKILHKVGQQSHTCKEPEDSRKLGSNTRQGMGHTVISPGSMHWKLQPTGYQQKQDHKKEDGKLPHQCLSCSAGPQCEDHPLTGLTAPSSHTAESTAHTVSSTFCPHCRALQYLFLGATRPSANRICMWFSKCHFIFKMQ